MKCAFRLLYRATKAQRLRIDALEDADPVSVPDRWVCTDGSMQQDGDRARNKGVRGDGPAGVGGGHDYN